MASKIRDDLVGVVHLPDGRVLKAGDEVPEGVEVGDHLIKDEKPTAGRRKSS